MHAQLGWTHISRTAVQRAEAQLADESQGVVDELGMLEIHQGYANRFFPGTSVLHTRLRYILFVAWAYESLRHDRDSPQDIGHEIAKQERRLGIALKHNTNDWGLIGRRTLPRMPTQRPSMMYWSALAEWGLLHRHSDGSLPSRAEIHARLAKAEGHMALQDDEGRSLQRKAPPFVQLPCFPNRWPDGAGIDFYLTDEERDFLRERLGSVHQPGTGRLSLLAKLVNNRAGERLGANTPLLCEEVRAVAEADWPTLQRADQAAAMAAITRGIYLTLVESLGVKDGLGERTVSLDNLNILVSHHRGKAIALSLDELERDVGFKPKSGVPQLLRSVQRWLQQNDSAANHNVLWPLLNDCLKQESNRKGSRGRLAPRATARRREWWQDKGRSDEQLPAPLHYRWNVVVNLLRDLEMKRPRNE